MSYTSGWMDDELTAFRDTVARFVEAEMVPQDARWRAQHHVDRETWKLLGDTGLLCLDIPEQYGGAGGDFRHEAVLYEELNRRGISGFGQGVHSICANYVLNHGTEEQKQRWLPRMAAGELIGAIAMTEPAAGSDLRGIRTRAVREGDVYRINGSKIFITNGGSATLLMLLVKTDPEARKGGMSLIMVETEGLAGYRVGRVLDKMGMHAQDTAELFFDDVRVPVDCLLGSQEGSGMHQLMADLPYERLIVALAGVASMEGGLRPPSRTPSHAKPSASPSANSRTPSSSWPSSPHWCASRGCSLTTASTSGSKALSTRKRPPWPNGGSPTPNKKSWTSACNCTAATAT
jgi:acyl-CoA dehydrogenase